ncbi:hypothetical protein BCR36DRAFT_587061 [Piromyces finnis]|uniref:Uncharacterized protein n=1 Tax=Piromyces finnis TaxID=1754191 RepID=A0A1Y1UWY5_9FUNG|nr:hypothetical protein BCR36DRAFT_587061 [Piromyces finnis]|eukprot:ORX42711.1 hypothetical protein BCR36DRAFT_587061 [Piromyces finnis]
MKFSTSLLALVAATSAAAASSVPFKRGMTIYPMEDKSTCLLNFLDENKECSELKIPDIGEDVTLFCKAINSDKCQKFLEESGPKVLECLGEDKLTEFEKKKIEYENELKRNYMAALCTKDDDGKYCPFVTSFSDSPEEYNYVINESCKSKACTDASYTILETRLGTLGLDDYKNTTFNEVFDIKDADPHGDSDYYAMAYLKSEQCTSKQSSPKSSDATTLNYSILATTLFALLYALF